MKTKVNQDYNAYEITPMQCIDDNSGIVEPIVGNDIDKIEPAFWSLFGHLRTGGVECISDHDTEKDAIMALAERALANAQVCLNDIGQVSYNDVDWVAIREARLFLRGEHG